MTGPVVLMFPGQGAQHELMAAGLYRGMPGFRDRVDAVLDRWGARGADIRRDWLADEPVVPLDDLRRSQPLLFAVDWALGSLLLDRSVEPAALVGHSVGEVVAATLAGVFTLDDAAMLMADRVDALADAPPGGMLAVAASTADIAKYLDADIALAAVNGPKQVMVAGAVGPLATMADRITSDGLTCRPVRTTSAFHSPVVAAAARRCLPGASRWAPRPPVLPLWSSYTGARLDAATATDPGFWVDQPAATVHFWPALQDLVAVLAPTHGDLTLVEAGPSQGLSSIARRHPAVSRGGSQVVAMLPTRRRDDNADVAAVTAAFSLLDSPAPAPV